MKKTFLVIGLDTFGLAVAEELTHLGYEVVALDMTLLLKILKP